MHQQEIIRRRRGDRASLKGIWSPVFRIIIALTIPMAVMTTNSWAQDTKILKTKLKGGVTNTNPAIPATKTSDNILPDGFSLRKIAEGMDPLENASGVITTFGNLNDTSPLGRSRMKIPTWSSMIIPAAQHPIMIMGDNFSFKATKTAATSPTLHASISTLPIPHTASHC